LVHLSLAKPRSALYGQEDAHTRFVYEGGAATSVEQQQKWKQRERKRRQKQDQQKRAAPVRVLVVLALKSAA